MRRIRNFFFLMRYPFMKQHNRWTGKFSGYAFTEYDSIPVGWRKAFGKQLLEDIKKAGKASRKRIGKHLSWRKMLTWWDIKEKWGTLRLYASATKEIQDVLFKYEALSEGYCINCGKPARYCTKGWVSYLCEDCYDKLMSDNVADEAFDEYKKEDRLTKDDLPIYTTYDNGEPHTVSLKEKYGIDLEDLWGLK